MKSYSDLLKDPRWQRRRLEVLEASGFACDECGNDRNTLHVHHRAYRKGAMPWEYGEEELECLCEICHKYKTDLINEIKTLIGSMDIALMEMVLGYCYGLRIHLGINSSINVRSEHHAEGLIDTVRCEAKARAAERLWDYSSQGGEVSTQGVHYMGRSIIEEIGD